jgi:hypothetical protein
VLRGLTGWLRGWRDVVVEVKHVVWVVAVLQRRQPGKLATAIRTLDARCTLVGKIVYIDPAREGLDGMA